jgi:DNA-binding transcriptional regulator YdaS (Cro superfamily)
MDEIKGAIQESGGYAAVARQLGVTRASVWDWVNITNRVPAERVIPLEQVIGLSRHVIRPDIYPEAGQ